MLRYNERLVTDLEGTKVSLALVFGSLICLLNVISVVVMLVMAG